MACGGVTPFSPAASSSFSTNGTPFNQDYGVGGVSGAYGTDTVAIGGNAVTGQQVGESRVVSGTSKFWDIRALKTRDTDGVDQSWSVQTVCG